MSDQEPTDRDTLALTLGTISCALGTVSEWYGMPENVHPTKLGYKNLIDVLAKGIISR